jgi:hypothetical protein
LIPFTFEGFLASEWKSLFFQILTSAHELFLLFWKTAAARQSGWAVLVLHNLQAGNAHIT